MELKTGKPELGQPTLQSYNMDKLYETIDRDLGLLQRAVDEKSLTPPSAVDNLADTLDSFIEMFELDVY